MFVVVFEVEPKAGFAREYLDLASEVKPAVEEIEGFISVERCASMTRPGRLVWVSYWEDDEAVKRWREHTRLLLAQLSSREQILVGYRITVAEVERQYGTMDRPQAPQPSP